MARHKDADWNLSGPNVKTWTEVQAALLMDLRDELKQMNRSLDFIVSTLRCVDFQRIPAKLDRIGRNTARPRETR